MALGLVSGPVAQCGLLRGVPGVRVVIWFNVFRTSVPGNLHLKFPLHFGCEAQIPTGELICFRGLARC